MFRVDSIEIVKVIEEVMVVVSMTEALNNDRWWVDEGTELGVEVQEMLIGPSGLFTCYREGGPTRRGIERNAITKLESEARLDLNSP
ncbi:hypothetical protein Vi05172_g2891 [Venturia inaequalis]|nr:hypothetical protein Vi05172_g2891 [Venturia inaequalis]